MRHTRLIAVAGVVMTALVSPPPATGAPDGSWEEPVEVAAPGTDVFDVELALHRDLALALWVRSRDRHNEVQLARRSAAGGWTTPAPVPAARGASEVEVAYDASGRARLAWTVGRRVETAWLRADGSTSRPVVLHRTPSGPLGTRPAHLQLAVEGAGATVVAWETMDDDAGPPSSSPSVQAVARDATGGWSGVRTLSARDVAAIRPEVFVSRTGRATVVWAQAAGRSWSVRSASRREDGAWGRTRSLTAPGVRAGVPQLAGLPSGRLAVAYPFRAGDRGGVAVRQWSRSQAWTRPVVLRGAGLRSRVDLALSRLGATVAFTGARDAVHTARVTRDGDVARLRLVPEVRVFSDLQVVADRAGDAVVAWDTVRGGDHPVHAAYLSRDGSPGPATRISEADGDAFLGDLGLSGGGRAVVLWSAGEVTLGGSWSVWSRFHNPEMG